MLTSIEGTVGKEYGMSRPATFVCLVGIDGVGKTTQLGKLARYLLDQGAVARRVHLRRPYFFSLPFLAYSRLRGLTQYRVVQGTRHGQWAFYRSRFLSTLFPLALLLDTALATAISVHLRLLFGLTVIGDRCLYDTLVDLMVGLDDEAYYQKPVGQLFLRLLPRCSMIILLDHEDVEHVRKRRTDLIGDPTLGRRQELYRALAAATNLPVVSTAQPIAATWHDIETLMEDYDLERDQR
jgi:thymidylate kinase